MAGDQSVNCKAMGAAATFGRTGAGRRMAAALVAVAIAVSAPLGSARAGMWPERDYEQLQPLPEPAPSYSRPRPLLQRPITDHRLAHRRPKATSKQAGAPQPGAKPTGPLLITISIARQHLRIYDQNGLFAESPVSTGMRGHPTPMGVFSVIQKSKYHRSNIYSGAPMPYMQRITWSGVALHAGVLPGYPASHGCIRMPMAFAVKLWGWSRLGARVIITPEDVTPAGIVHQALMTGPPQPGAPAPAAASNKAAPKGAGIGTAVSTAGATSSEPPRPASSDRMRIADAEPGLPAHAASGEPQEKPAVNPSQPNDTMAARQKVADAAPTAAAPAPSAPVAGSPAKASAPAPLPASAPADVAVAPKRSGHVAVLISRKAGRLYVRQNFEPWFDVPLTIAQPDRPLGTHVFTASADPTDAGSLHWTVVSLPQLPKHHDVAEEAPRRGKRAAPVVETEAPPSPTPSEALDRLTIPPEAAARIAAALAPGASIIVSDHGLGDETGLGTDFIVPLR